MEVVHAGGSNLGVFTSGFGNNSYPGGAAIFMGNLQPNDDLWFREGPVSSVSSCTLELLLTFGAGTLTMDFLLGTTDPVIWSTWLIAGNIAVPLWSVPLPAFPATPFSLPIPGFPGLGVIGVLTTFGTADGIFCWDFAIVDTGGP